MASAVCTQPWRFAVPPFAMADNLYYVGSRAVSSHLIDTGDGLILLDCGFPQTVYLLLESIRRIGFDPDDIRIILNTHAHYDHVGGTRAIAELTGAETVLGADDVPAVTDRPELTESDLMGMEFHESFDVTRPVCDGDQVTLGSTVVDCIAAPGHTAGTMAYCFNVSVEGAPMRAGIHGGPGCATLTDEYLTRHNLPFDLRAAYLRSVERLRREHIDIHLGAHPGQSRTFQKRDERPGDPLAFVNPADWPAYLDTLDATWQRRFGNSG